MSQPIPPTQPAPDTKDWTWVLERACPDCGFDPAAATPETLPDQIRAQSDRVRIALDRVDSHVRPAPTTWSAVEYGQHLADGCEVMTQRLQAILDAEGDGAEFDSWDGDKEAEEDEYWRASAHVTSVLLRERAEHAANEFSRPEADQWEWTGRRSDGVVFTAAGLGAYLLHELTHHAADAGA